MASSVKILEARRNARGIHVTARCSPAPQGAVYAVQLIIDPSTAGVISASFWLHNRSGANRVRHDTTLQAGMALEIRDQFLKLPAWEILLEDPPQWPTAVTPEGNTIARSAQGGTTPNDETAVDL